MRVRRCAQHGGSRPLLDLPLFLPDLLTLVHRFPLGLMASATIAFRPFDVIFSLRTLCFLERAQRFPASVGNPSFFRAIAMIFKAVYLLLIPSSRSLGLYFEKRGRRQLPQAGEVRRPLAGVESG